MGWTRTDIVGAACTANNVVAGSGHDPDAQLFSQGPFSAVVDKAVTNPWLRSFLDLECFVLSGMTAAHTL